MISVALQYCIVSVHLYSVSCSAHQSEALQRSCSVVCLGSWVWVWKLGDYFIFNIHKSVYFFSHYSRKCSHLICLYIIGCYNISHRVPTIPTTPSPQNLRDRDHSDPQGRRLWINDTTRLWLVRPLGIIVGMGIHYVYETALTCTNSPIRNHSLIDYRRRISWS